MAVDAVSAERVERTGGLLVHHPGPPPLGTAKPLRVFKVAVPSKRISTDEAELLGPPVLDAAWWDQWREYASTTTTPQREEPQP